MTDPPDRPSGPPEEGLEEEVERAVSDFFQADAPVAAAPAPGYGDRSWRRRLAAWLVPAVVLSAGAAVAVKASIPSEGRTELDLYAPQSLGATWVYRTHNLGQDAGLRVVQVVGRALLLEGPAVVVESRFENFLGRGQPARFRRYQGIKEGRLFDYGDRSTGPYQATEPPQPMVELPFSDGHSWSWEGTQSGEKRVYRSTLLGRERMTVAGRQVDGCLHYRSVTSFVSNQPTEGRADEWYCPGLGVVRSHEEAPAVGLVFDQDLVEFHGADGGLGGSPVGAVSEIGTALGFDSSRSFSVAGARFDPSRPAWTDMRKEHTQFPPVGSSDTLVLTEPDGVVSALSMLTGEIRWRVGVAAPVVVAPLVAEPLVLVAGADKVLWAFDLTTGAARWSSRLPDLPASAPLAAHGLVVFAGEDRRVRALRLSDGSRAWQAQVTEQVRAPLAVAGDVVVAVDEGGGLSAFALSDGSSRWSASMEREPAAGPLASGGMVVTADRSGNVYGFDAANGDSRWTEYLNDLVRVQAAATSDTVVLATDARHLYGLRTADGSRRWESRLEAEAVIPPAILGEEVAVVTEGNRLARIGLADGRDRGSVGLHLPTTEFPVTASLPLAYMDGLLVVTLSVERPWPATALVAYPAPSSPQQEARWRAPGVVLSGGLRTVPEVAVNRISLSDGDLIYAAQSRTAWVAPSVGPPRPLLKSPDSVPFALPAGNLVLTQRGTDLVALPRAGGPPVWTSPMGPPFLPSIPAVAGDRVIVPLRGTGIVSLETATGRPQWLHEITAGVGGSTPLVLPDGDVVYAVGGVVRLAGATGEPRWTLPGVDAFAPIAQGSGVVAVVGVTPAGEALVCIDEATGAERWRVPFSAALLVGPAVAGPVVVAVSDVGLVQAFDRLTGAPVWSRKLRSPPDASPVVVGGRVVVAETGDIEDSYNREHRVTVLDAATGRFLGSAEPPGNGFDLAAFAAAGDDTVLVPTLTSDVAVMVLKVT